MTELYEKAALEIAGEDSTSCLFDCGKTCDVSNEFGRPTGKKKFGRNLALGEPTIRFRCTDDGNFIENTATITAQFPPENVPGEPNEWGWAAHHLIPVATLREHNITKYFDKGKKVVFCNVGYNVNGVTNGLWLIASYGEGMQGKLKRNEDGEETWVVSMVLDSIKQAGIAIKKKPGTNKYESIYTTLSRDAREDDLLGFREYLFHTMKIYKRQFHDAHGEYDKCVKLALDKIYTNIKRDRMSCLKTGGCKNPKKPMAPHHVAHRLDGMSLRLKDKLNRPASLWKRPFVTSIFSLMYADEVRKGIL